MDTLDEIESLPWFRGEVRRLRERAKELETALTDISCIDGGQIGDFQAVENIHLIAEAALRGKKGLE